ncbi:MAG: FAD-dependent oxidoreductase [Actinobacteria bacterium]|nr:FAD-dependent oxidoreductase [Actinomycetota bacterium]
MTTVTTCCVVGGGPAGMVLGYLLARAGIAVTVLEKHGGFLRDFRGDTIHPSTAQLMDELGLGTAFGRLPIRTVDTVHLVTDDGTYAIADFSRIPGPHRLGFLPQWDFLNFLTEQAERYPGFDLRMRAEAVDVVRHGTRIAGVLVRDTDGELSELHADLIVAADGRDSTIRAAVDLPIVEHGAPIDVLWFRVSKHDDDPESAFGRLTRGHFMVMIDRGDYWQAGYLIVKGEHEHLRAEGIDEFRRRVADVAPFLSDRLDEISSWDDAPLLSVQVNRLRRWWRPGLLCIGDAAHAMSPVAGVGINLAVQDAVAAARILAGPLRTGRVSPWHLARVQVRRTLPTAVTQRVQRLAQDRVISPVIHGEAGGRTPLVIRALDRVPALRTVPAFAIGHGVLPEHVP